MDAGQRATEYGQHGTQSRMDEWVDGIDDPCELSDEKVALA
jgi:hypothetical protein